jgi:two-component system response regulator AtoC
LTARILVVDDEKDLAEYLAEELTIEGYHTATAYDGVDAVLNAIENEWDAVLMDIRMPKLDGIGALKIIRRIKPDLPIILFTGQANQSEMMASKRLGAFTCLLKPITTDHLFKTLNQVLINKTT